MTGCERQGAGVVELYFYDELEQADRLAVEHHLQSCTDCRRAFEELSTIRSVLAARPRIDAPPDGDWTPFMQRLDRTLRFEDDLRPHRRVVPIGPARAGVGYARYLTMAALLTLVTAGVVSVVRLTSRPPASSPSIGALAPVAGQGSPAESAAIAAARSAEAAFAALSEQHFERSKLVVLGLANMDPRRAGEADWAYERGLASNLLSDTRLYRLAAEERGMKTLAGVMGDLEIVLLQTSLADVPDAGALEQIQRLIHKRDLVTKMDASTTGS
jgi:Putative zinc-finger